MDLDWSYAGYNAFYQVSVTLNAFVTSGGITTIVPLVHDGPVNCCTPPSGGFTYSGTTTLVAAIGDTYGFMFSGSNYDADGRLLGTLTVAVTATGPTPQVARIGYCAAADNTNPTTGQATPPGTFLDLVTGQPAADSHYRGATAASYVQGKGITCDPPPTGYVHDGFAGSLQHVSTGVYPYYKPAS